MFYFNFKVFCLFTILYEKPKLLSMNSTLMDSSPSGNSVCKNLKSTLDIAFNGIELRKTHLEGISLVVVVLSLTSN